MLQARFMIRPGMSAWSPSAKGATMPNQAIAHDIHRLPHHVLATALPDLRTPDVWTDVRTEFARWTVCQREHFSTWRHAWNSWTRATTHRHGHITVTVLCTDCRGRMFSTKRGIPGPCTTCCGRRRITVHSRAIWQPVTDPSHR